MKLNCFLMLCMAFEFLVALPLKAQVPIINSFEPLSGSIGTVVTISGSNFGPDVADNMVYFGATKAAVTASTQNQLTVMVPVGATFQPITVTTGGLTAYSRTPFVVTFASSKTIDQTSFSNKVDFATGDTPVTVAVTDIDGDGKSEIIATNAFSSSISVFRNTSSAGDITTGSFDPRMDFYTGYGPRGLTMGDLDGDGKQDLVALYNGTTISVFRNISTSGTIDANSFGPRIDFLVDYGIALTNVVIRDLDADGLPDLAVTEQIGNKVLVFKNMSAMGVLDANSFGPKVELATGTLPLGIETADLDNDGKPELAVVNYGSNAISVYKNKSVPGIIDENSFATKVDFDFNQYGSVYLAIGDLDGDKKPDIVVSSSNSNTISVLQNTSMDGEITLSSFTKRASFETAVGPKKIIMSDLDGDSKVDLAVADFSENISDNTANKVSVFKNLITSDVIDASSFAAKVDFTTGVNPFGLAIGDVDGDGRPDLITTNYNGNSISVLWNKKSQTIINFTTIPNKNVGDAAFTLSASASSDLPVLFTTTSDKVTIVGNQVTILKPGSITITAEQPGNSFYSAAPAIVQTFCIYPAKPIISVNLAEPAKPILTSSSEEGNQWYLNDDRIEGAVSKTILIEQVGVYKVKITIDGCSTFSESETFVLNDQTILFEPVPEKNIGDAPFNLVGTASSGMAVQFSTTSDKISINGTQVTIVKAGSVAIKADQNGNNLFSSAPSVSRTFCINPTKPTLTFDITDPAQPVLTSSHDEGNQWYLNDQSIEGAKGKSHIVQHGGVYKVKVSIDNCSSPFSESQTFLVTNTYLELPVKSQLFPNPVNDMLTIRLRGFDKDHEVVVWMKNTAGENLITGSGKDGDDVIMDVKSISPGLYYLVLEQGAKKQYGKIIKK
jgi:hypothetical protein